MRYIISFYLLLLTTSTHAHPGHGFAPNHTVFHYLIDHYQLIVILVAVVIYFINMAKSR